MAGSEAEWITLANNLLFKCHIHLRIHELEDCDANVFIALYQSILGEKVPDLITIPKSQEDEAHNVQAVIDSLALDYLQVSLSHITGENIVKGDKESIKNLLEIFDGLLEYLTEHISETSYEKSPHGSNDTQFKKASTSPSSKSREDVFSPPSSSFLSKNRTSFVEDTETPSFSVIPSARKLGEPIRAAIPLHPPYHPAEPRAPCPIGKEYLQASRCSPAVNSTGEAVSVMLRSALGDRVKDKTDHKEDDTGNEEVESGNEEALSQHSDSIMEYGPKKPRPGLSMRRKPLCRSHSLSPSPLNKHRQLHVDRKRQRKPKETDIRQFRAKALTEAFERELRRNKVQENIAPLEINDEENTEKTYREVVHEETPKRTQPWKIYSRKPTAHSPKGGFLKPNKAIPMKVNEHSLLPLMLEQFPFLYVSGPTLSKMWKQQIAQVEQLHRDAARENRSKKKLQDEIEEALRRHDLLTALVKKEYEHNKRLQDFKDRIHRQRLTQSKIKENRQQIARARKYYDDYRVQLRAKMMRMRTREEMIFKKLFEEGLQIQKQRLRDLRNYAKEKRDEQKRQHQNELDSMENYYKDQFSLLAEAISQERQELKARERSQAQMLHKVKRELRAKMEKEIQQLQYIITQNDDDAFFRELEAERFRSRLQLASFQYSKNPFP
ncbi:Centrosomal protein of 95 kDa [Tupaia chinensis]|uniref:Centrosomal protein of 95 kDa n=1 Tax=Tupaia chinensis TaxID=246437 RepID=L9L2A1_TUPCH|nr:Centrosomal protein of 95 kDa [Tupaia chinensis]